MAGNYRADFAFVDAQLDEMEKIALGAAGAGRLIGGLAGAGIGGTAGAMTGPEDQRVGRAIKGALIGGLAGAAGGQAATAAGRKQAIQFGQRQLHGATGYLPGRGLFGQNLQAVGGVSKQQARVKALREMGWKVPKKVDTVGVGKITPTSGAVDKAIAAKSTGPISGLWRGTGVDRALTKQKLRSQAAQRLLAEEGMTSLPGLARGYLKGTDRLSRAGALKANLLAPGAALGVGLPVAFAAPGVAEGVQQRDWRPAAKSIVESAGYSLGGGLPMAAALGAGTGISTAAGKLFGSPQPPAQAGGAPPVLPGRAGQVGQIASGAVR